MKRFSNKQRVAQNDCCASWAGSLHADKRNSIPCLLSRVHSHLSTVQCSYLEAAAIFYRTNLCHIKLLHVLCDAECFMPAESLPCISPLQMEMTVDDVYSYGNRAGLDPSRLTPHAALTKMILRHFLTLRTAYGNRFPIYGERNKYLCAR